MAEIFIQYSNEAEVRCDYSTEHHYIKQFLPSLSSSCVMEEFCTVTRQGAYLEIEDAPPFFLHLFLKPWVKPKQLMQTSWLCLDTQI